MIKQILSNALLSILMDKKAKKIFKGFQKKRVEKSIIENMQFKSSTHSSSEKFSGDLNTNKNRQSLIKKALKAHKDNSSVLEDLNEDQKQRLRQLAIKILLKSNKKSNIYKERKQQTNIIDKKNSTPNKVLNQETSIKRQILIKNALAAHKKHSKALDGLSGNQKKKLQRLAMEMMFSRTNK